MKCAKAQRRVEIVLARLQRELDCRVARVGVEQRLVLGRVQARMQPEVDVGRLGQHEETRRWQLRGGERLRAEGARGRIDELCRRRPARIAVAEDVEVDLAQQ